VLINSDDPNSSPYGLESDKITVMPQSAALLRGFHDSLR
jgi:hypothetical protein